jgi:hypothetical protein
VIEEEKCADGREINALQIQLTGNHSFRERQKEGIQLMKERNQFDKN